ncbi:hypothetical protein [Subtercola endophyticus]|uniref:hypothetical protein n=1 Tax=Subtercola endophyticus TaxID=2895559 RepID=UPI001E389470|nr:hypothetical protein [Subtercola endophyticus]UFS57632.1 hypothetical protein LQ955_11225 [Subtercola endophyticus]
MLRLAVFIAIALSYVFGAAWLLLSQTMASQLDPDAAMLFGVMAWLVGVQIVTGAIAVPAWIEKGPSLPAVLGVLSVFAVAIPLLLAGSTQARQERSDIASETDCNGLPSNEPFRYSVHEEGRPPDWGRAPIVAVIDGQAMRTIQLPPINSRSTVVDIQYQPGSDSERVVTIPISSNKQFSSGLARILSMGYNTASNGPQLNLVATGADVICKTIQNDVPGAATG